MSEIRGDSQMRHVTGSTTDTLTKMSEIKIIKCYHCGAPLDRKDLKCKFCGYQHVYKGYTGPMDYTATVVQIVDPDEGAHREVR